MGQTIVTQNQFLCVVFKCTSYVPVTCGIPQKPLRAPVLFTINVNDVDSDLNNSITKPADKAWLATQVYPKIPVTWDR